MMKNRRRGFTLSECAVLVVIIGLLAAVVMPMLGAARHRMRGMSSAQKLMLIGQGGMMYAQDNNDRLFSYTWRAGETYTLPDGRVRMHNDDAVAAAWQNQEILQRRTGRIAGVYKIQTVSARIPHSRYTHLVLMDYLGEPFPGELFIDPSDANQFVWSANPLDYGPGSGVPYAKGIPDGHDDDSNWTSNPVRQRWAFASSYQIVPSAWQPNGNGRYIPDSSTPHLFRGAGDFELSQGRRITDVLHNANKVWMFEEFDRDRADSLYFAYDEAQSEKLMFDGSVNDWASGDAAPSMVPERGLFHWRQTYVPLDTFPIPVGGLNDPTQLSQRYRWTYGGLSGINYGAFSFGGLLDHRMSNNCTKYIGYSI